MFKSKPKSFNPIQLKNAICVNISSQKQKFLNNGKIRNESLFFDFNGLFDGCLAVACLVFHLLSDLELFEDRFFHGDFCNSLGVCLG